MIKKQLILALCGIAFCSLVFAEGKASPEAKEIKAAKFISCVDASINKKAPAADLTCEKFKNLEKATQAFTEGKHPRGLTAAVKKIDSANLASLSEPDKKLVQAAKVTEVYKKLKA